MGHARKKKHKFLVEHPLCCFCGGAASATTIDHVPNRDCFKGRAFPETFEFPACADCQVHMRQDEQIFSFVVQMVDRNSANYDRRKARRAIQGIKNNFPDLMPNMLDDPATKYAALHRLGQGIPIFQDPRSIPVIALPLEIDKPIKRVASKIAIAMFYRELNRVVPSSYLISISWSFATDRYSMKGVSQVAEMARFHTRGWRRNVEFGDQFRYHWDCSDGSDSSDLFMLVAQFGEGMVVVAFVADPDTAQKSGGDDWVSVKRLFSEDGGIY